ncbi:hypothetical protein OMW55_06390 [Sphingomonas sp. BN140010]|uniref:Uncharacterized protein n=1 Tax=Sphingomonas arvum TaxID=2992113 RepID=A0ABT3JEG3_9SPHN|nr:hypothetical protein [Sphingomonas sp. BN140010]MCW3797431.1 hypothetical protein [Sphingomonas sp. BN140010]
MVSKLLAGAALLVSLGACQARDEGNGSTVISVDREAVDNGLDQAGDALTSAGNEVKDAADKAGPALENAADRTGAAAKRAGDKVENTADNVDVDVNVRNDQKR